MKSALLQIECIVVVVVTYTLVLHTPVIFSFFFLRDRLYDNRTIHNNTYQTHTCTIIK